MTNVNHNPANDFPIGSLGMDNAEDTEGHIRARPMWARPMRSSRRLEEADTEGHIKRSLCGRGR